MPFYAGNLDGMFVVVDEGPSWDEPVLVRLFYPTGLRWAVAAFNGIPEGAPLEEDRLPGGFLYREKGWHRPIMIALQEGGKTKPVKVEKEEIPRPKVRKGTEVRWQYGKWEKRLAKGWVTA